MLQISNLKLFFSTAPSSPFRFSFNPSSFSSPFLSKLKTPLKPFSIFTVVSSSARRDRNLPYLRSRNNSTLRQTNSRKDNKSVPMEETSKGSLGFNKKRAEGRDKNDKPKTLQLKVRKLNPVNTISYIQILGTGLDTQDTSPSVLLFFDKQRIIFNAGEGLQRYCTEHKIKLSKIDHIFHSRVCSETAGGLPGLLLTLAGMGEEGMSINIWGPSDLKYLVDAIRSFIPTAAMVHTHSFGPTPNADGASSPRLGKFTDPIVLLDDEVVKLSAILVRPSCSVVSQQMNDDSTLSDPSSGLDEEIDELLGPLVPYSKNLKRGVQVIKPGDISVIYICELPEIKGKFDPSKAVALGLKPGPKYRDLQLGDSVMSDKKDIMVHPSDVLGPSVPGPIVLIVDCPTPSHLHDLLSIESLSSYYSDCVDQQIDGVKSVNCIIHLSPSSITKTATYQKWMKRFGEAQHIMAGHEIKNLEIPILKASARVAARLNYLCPNFFPAPGLWSLEHLNNFVPDPNASSEGSTPKLCDSISAENLLKFHLRPYAQLGLDRSGVPNLLVHKDIVNDLISEIPEITDSVARVSQLWDESSETKRVPKQEDMVEEPWMNAHASIPNINLEEQHNSGLKKFNINEDCHESVLPSCLENISREDMEIVLLGTGSSQPSKYRNVSSIYLNLFSKGGLLLDCGEGTLGQLTRRFGVKGADAVVRGLRCIWISHIHADHHTGLARILALRSELLRGIPHDPLLVIGPGPLKRFLDAYKRLEDIDMQFLDCKQTTEASWDAFENTLASNGTHSPPRSPAISEDVYNGDGTGAATQNIDTSLFAKGSLMQSYWKRPSSPIMTAAGIQHLKNLKKLLEEVGLEALLSVRVVHCPQAYGLVVKAAERKNKTGKTIPGWKLVYSGDTRPCQALIDASHGATVLIHEATFEDGMVEEAIARNHSTTEEAIKVGNSAEAYRIILTHFSQRYPKIPIFDETHMHKTCIGFDLMSVNVADLPILPQVLPHLKLLFKNEIMADESDDVLAL